METVFIVCDSQKPVSLSNLRASFSGVVQTGRIQEEIPRTQRLSPQQVLGESSLDVFFFFLLTRCFKEWSTEDFGESVERSKPE